MMEISRIDACPSCARKAVKSEAPRMVGVKCEKCGASIDAVDWVVVRFTPPGNERMFKTCARVVCMFEPHYLVRQAPDGEQVFQVYGQTGNILSELAIFIAKKPGGRELPQIEAVRKQLESPELPGAV